MGLEIRQNMIPQCDFLDIEEQYFRITVETISNNYVEEIEEKLGHQIFCNSNHSFGKISMLVSST